MVPDYFSVRWSGWVTFEPGLYRFYARADDGIRLFVDGNLVLDAWSNRDANRVSTADMTLDGQHWLVVDYFESTGVALVEFGLGQVNTPATTPLANEIAPPPAPAPGNTIPPADPTQTQALKMARTHLVSLTGLPAAEVSQVSVEAVDWPSTLLGCSAEEVMSLPVVTPGYRIILAARGQFYEYHTDRQGRIVLCESGGE